MRKSNLMLGLPILLAAACSNDNNQRPDPVNQAPTIAAIGDQTVSANMQSQPIAFSVNDEAVGQLTFEVLSDNSDLLPVSAITITGSANPLSLIATPSSDRVGDSLITVIATDGEGLSGSTAFLLTVEAQQVSLQQFTRDTFAREPNSEPSLINAIEFTDDAENDDFVDLLAN